MNIIDYSLKVNEIKKNIQTNIFDLLKAQNLTPKKNINYQNNKLINNKRNRTYFRKKITKNENQNLLFDIRNKNKIIKDILEYGTNFEKSIQKFSKKYFWKIFIFKKYGGQEKMGIDILNNIKNFNFQNKTKLHKSHSISESFNDIKNNLKNKLNNNIIRIPLIDDEETNNNEEYLKEENSLLSEISKRKDLLFEYRFLFDFFFYDEYLKEFKVFGPQNFLRNSKNIYDQIRQKNSLKLFGILKLVLLERDNYIILNNVKFLEDLANNIAIKLGSNLYQKIIDLLYKRLKTYAFKIKFEKRTEN